MGEEADDIVQSLGISGADQKKYDVVKKRLEDFFIIKRNVIFERAKFNLRNQQQNESAEVFITDLFNLAEHCNFGVLREELIRDRIVVGIRDKSLSERLQLEAELTLEKAVNFVRQKETVRKQKGFLGAEGRQSIDFVGKFSKKDKEREIGQYLFPTTKLTCFYVLSLLKSLNNRIIQILNLTVKLILKTNPNA